MRKRFRPRSIVGLTIVVAALVVVPLALAGAINTTTDPGQTVNGMTTGVCINGPDPSVNCNIYQQKEDVFLSGSPVSASLGAGTYYFAVLDPGGQPNPNPGAADLLSSDLLDIQREFSINDAGTIANLGDHLLDSNKLSVWPYNDTSNPGGVYILAVCKIGSGQGAVIDPVPNVKASDCKYDAFKVKESSVPGASGPTILKDAVGSYNNTYTWDIEKKADKTVVHQIGGTASFTYTVHVTHDGGTISDVAVNGTITVFNPNDGSMVADVTDQLSDGTPCSVTGGSGATLASGDNTFAYSCDLGSTVPTSINNVATVTWADQTLDPDGPLAAGSADFTFSSVSFTGTNVANCTNVTDPLPLGGTSNDNPFPTTVCVGGAGDGGAGAGATAGFTFVYHVSYNVGTGCTSYTNTATESTDGQFASVTVRVCGPANNSALTLGFWKGPNGQALITYYGAGLYTWLDQYAPLSSVNSLVDINAVFKAASATNMNAMLKAQMLVTALDVYFSDPTLGYSATNKTVGGKTIKAPSNFLTHGPLGGFNMDMTAICPMIDNTTAGTATCKNNTPSTDAFASGAVPSAAMTVQAILTFAGTSPYPYNAGSWYGTDRTKQEILKNIFDQINNNDAFAA